MKDLHDRSYKNFWKKYAFTILAFIAFSGILGVSIAYIRETNRMQNIALLRQAVNRTAVECYSIEGLYPPDVSYLEDNYGLTYDHDKYFIFYDAFASNIMPTIEVYER